jgi:cytoskeletal protein RodZ
LIGPPLLAAILFCFGFVMMHSHQPVSVKTSTSRSQATNQTSAPQTNLSIPSGQTLETKTPAQTTDTTTNSVGSTNPTTSPQSSGSTSNNLQSAVPNYQSQANRKIEVRHQPGNRNLSLPTTKMLKSLLPGN